MKYKPEDGLFIYFGEIPFSYKGEPFAPGESWVDDRNTRWFCFFKKENLLERTYRAITRMPLPKIDLCANSITFDENIGLYELAQDVPRNERTKTKKLLIDIIKKRNLLNSIKKEVQKYTADINIGVMRVI